MNSNGIITAPVNLKSDIATVLGVSDTRLSVLCTSSNINKWSRHKPIRFASNLPPTDEQLKQNDFGLQFPEYSQNWKTAINNATYNYLPPRGGSSEPYRFGDFIYYNRDSMSPCKKCVDFTFDTTIVGNQFLLFLNLNHMGHDDYNIGLDEIGSLTSKYLACVLEYDDGRGNIKTLWKTSTTTLGNSGFSLTFTNLDKNSMHNIKYYFLAASRIQEQQTSDISYVDFYGLPFNTPEDASANINLISTNPFTVNFLGCASSPTSSSYISKEEAVPGGLSFNVSGISGLWLQSEITAKISYTLKVSDLYGEMRPCWVLGTATDRTTTTGLVPMELYIYKNGTWNKVVTSTTSFMEGETYTIRIGNPEWAYYKDGVKQTYLKASIIYDEGYLNTYDNNTGYSLGNSDSCRIGLIST